MFEFLVCELCYATESVDASLSEGFTALKVMFEQVLLCFPVIFSPSFCQIEGMFKIAQDFFSANSTHKPPPGIPQDKCCT